MGRSSSSSSHSRRMHSWKGGMYECMTCGSLGGERGRMQNGCMRDLYGRSGMLLPRLGEGRGDWKPMWVD